MAKICLVTPAHLGSNPRIVKEANVLSAAGFKTHVIYADTFEAARIRDAAILRNATWTFDVIQPKTLGRRVSATKRKLATMALRCGISLLQLSELAHHSLVGALTQSALQCPADMYIGHCLAALPAVVKAARKHGAIAGFDAEDYHSGELDNHGKGCIQNAIARKIEDFYLPHLDHFTAASPLIAEEYQKRFRRLPATILNVFPKCEAPPVPRVADDSQTTPSFYWFSQTIGKGRGLEEILQIGKQMSRPIRFDFRGHCRPDYEQELRQLLHGSPIELRILPPENPDRMVSLAAGYTAGLALERTEPLNRDLCLTNKAFTYLLAGTPVIFSPTSAQLRLAKELGDAAILLDPRLPQNSTQTLNQWLDQKQHVIAAKVAWELGQKRFNWDHESQILLSEVAKTVSHTNSVASREVQTC